MLNWIGLHYTLTPLSLYQRYALSVSCPPVADAQLRDVLDTTYFKSTQTNSALTPRKATNSTFQQYYSAKLYAKAHSQSSVQSEAPSSHAVPPWATPHQRKDRSDLWTNHARSSTMPSHLVTPTRRGVPCAVPDKQILGFSFIRTQTAMPRMPTHQKAPQLLLDNANEVLFDVEEVQKSPSASPQPLLTFDAAQSNTDSYRHNQSLPIMNLDSKMADHLFDD